MKKICLIILFVFATTATIQAQWLWDIDKMSQIKAQKNTLAYSPAYKQLISQADNALNRKMYSVVHKKGIAPSGDKHDYVSLSRYWWRNPETSNGLPYIFKDGQSNPELEHYDRNVLGSMCATVNTLSLAYFYTGEEKYAKKAVQFLRAWFIDKNTKMNPNLEYSQFIPGRDNSKGRPEGLIDSYSFVEMLNSVQLLKSSKSFTKLDQSTMQRWFKDFASWLQTSKQGIKENNASNNHATAYDSQLITYLLFAGDEKGARRIVDNFPKKRIFAQIEKDGKQTNELWRTLAYHYSWYNLNHMLDVCATANKMGVNLLAAQSNDGRSIYAATDYLVTFLGKDVSEWPYKQISGWEAKQQDVCYSVMRIVNMDPTRSYYRDVVKQHAKFDRKDRLHLLYGSIDPIDEFFSFAGDQLSYAMQRTDSKHSELKNKKDIMPRSIDKNGQLVLVSPRDWCSGFFPGSLWFMYEQTKDNKWLNVANQYSYAIEQEKNDPTSHDVGFKINCSFGNGYVATSNPAYKEIMIQAATTLAKRYNPQVKAIRSWDFNRQVWQFPVIIDNMMNLELLFEAARLSGNQDFYTIADNHAATTLKNHFRSDFSSFHVIDYDTVTTQVRKKNTHQGIADESAWARGQAWALYGYTMSYRYTEKADYLKLAESIANFIFTNPQLPRDLVPFWDYNDPAIPNAPRDVSAACITASALYELAAYSKNKDKYIALADNIVTNLMDHYRARKGADEGFLLLHSTGHYPHKSEIDVPISYADYYFLEALSRRKKLDSM